MPTTYVYRLTDYRYVQKGRNESFRRAWVDSEVVTEPNSGGKTEKPDTPTPAAAKPKAKKKAQKVPVGAPEEPPQKDPLVEAKNAANKEVSRVQAIRAQAETLRGCIMQNHAYNWANNPQMLDPLAIGLEELKDALSKSQLRQEFQTLAFKDWKAKHAKDNTMSASAIVELNTMKDELSVVTDKLGKHNSKIVKMHAAGGI